MSCDFLALAQPGVQKLSPYVPGKPVDELARDAQAQATALPTLARRVEAAQPHGVTSRGQARAGQQGPAGMGQHWLSVELGRC